MNLKKAVMERLEKARVTKYVKRTGSKGNYKYWYKDPSTGKLTTNKPVKPKGEPGESKGMSEAEIIDRVVNMSNQELKSLIKGMRRYIGMLSIKGKNTDKFTPMMIFSAVLNKSKKPTTLKTATKKRTGKKTGTKKKVTRGKDKKKRKQRSDKGIKRMLSMNMMEFETILTMLNNRINEDASNLNDALMDAVFSDFDKPIEEIEKKKPDKFLQKKMDKAYKSGQKAFKAGAIRRLSDDTEFMDFLENSALSRDERFELAKEWNRGWDEAKKGKENLDPFKEGLTVGESKKAAFQLGKKAFENGLPRKLQSMPDFFDKWVEGKVGNRKIPIGESWFKGWDAASSDAAFKEIEDTAAELEDEQKGTADETTELTTEEQKNAIVAGMDKKDQLMHGYSPKTFNKKILADATNLFSKKEFKTMKTLANITRDETRFFMWDGYIDGDFIITTDGKQLYKLPKPKGIPEKYNNKKIKFSGNKAVIMEFEGNFPKYDRVIPDADAVTAKNNITQKNIKSVRDQIKKVESNLKSEKAKMSVNRRVLFDAKRMEIVAYEQIDQHGKTFRFMDDKLNTGDAETTINKVDATIAGPNIVGVNIYYLDNLMESSQLNPNANYEFFYEPEGGQKAMGVIKNGETSSIVMPMVLERLSSSNKEDIKKHAENEKEFEGKSPIEKVKIDFENTINTGSSQGEYKWKAGGEISYKEFTENMDKKIDLPKNEIKTLFDTVSKDDARPYLRFPYVKDGKIASTNGKALTMINAPDSLKDYEGYIMLHPKLGAYTLNDEHKNLTQGGFPKYENIIADEVKNITPNSTIYKTNAVKKDGIKKILDRLKAVKTKDKKEKNVYYDPETKGYKDHEMPGTRKVDINNLKNALNAVMKNNKGDTYSLIYTDNDNLNIIGSDGNNTILAAQKIKG